MIVSVILEGFDCCNQYGTIQAKTRLTGVLLATTPNFIVGQPDIEVNITVPEQYIEEGITLTATFCGQTQIYTIVNLVDVKVKVTENDCESGYLQNKIVLKLNGVEINSTVDTFSCNEKLVFDIPPQAFFIPPGTIWVYWIPTNLESDYFTSTGLGINELEGWAICNGQTHSGYTTPNLINRFIAGKNIGDPLGTVGTNLSQPYSAFLAQDNIPQHSHVIPSHSTKIGDGSHIHSPIITSEDGDHYHTALVGDPSPGGGTFGLGNGDGNAPCDSSPTRNTCGPQFGGSSQPNHTHQVNFIDDGDHVHDIDSFSTQNWPASYSGGQLQPVLINQKGYSKMLYIVKLP